jgi:hypothetical protein
VEWLTPPYLTAAETSAKYPENLPMSNSALRKARDLAPDVRDALETLVGRRLQEEETVSVQAYPLTRPLKARERDDSWRRLMECIDETATRVKGVSEAKLDALITEAAVRHHPAS